MSNPDKLETTISQLFVETGEKERLLRMLRLRLSEAGWNDSLNAYCRGNCMFFVKYMNDSQQYTIEIVRNKNLGNITFDGLCEEVSDYGRSTIHESIKVDILEEIKKFIDKHMG